MRAKLAGVQRTRSLRLCMAAEPKARAARWDGNTLRPTRPYRAGYVPRECGERGLGPPGGDGMEVVPGVGPIGGACCIT
eukprot:8417172-Pyramimonas_sp.AAC.1